MQCKLDNITVNYDTYGEGRPLILLPGWSMDVRAEAHLMEPYLHEQEGWQRIYIDPPGHGRTPGAEWVTGLDQMLDVLLACIDKIIPGQRFALGGYSLGAYLARGILYHRPASIDGLLMIAPAIVTVDAGRDIPEHVILVEDPQVMASLSAEEHEMMEIIVVRSRTLLDQMRAWPEFAEHEQSDFEYLQAIREDPTRYCCSYNIDVLEQPFEKPALIITGRQDSAVGYADAWRLLDNYPRATFTVFDRAGHLLEEKEPLIGPLVNEWLDRVEENLTDQ